MSSAPGSTPRILIVEDDVGNALVMKTILIKLGAMKVQTTEDGEFVLGQVGAGSIDLVVMDVSLTNTKLEGKSVDGLELTRRIKELDRFLGGKLRVLLATAHAMRGDAEKFMSQSGADGYISKPIVDHAGFVAKVRSMLGG